MFFSLKELIKWLGLTLFELWLLSTCLIISSVLVVLKIEAIIDFSWWTVLGPLFLSDALNAYFCVIIFIRMYLEGAYKSGALQALWSLSVLVLLFVCKFLLCQKLEDSSRRLSGIHNYSEILSPILLLSLLVMVRSCQLHWVILLIFDFMIFDHSIQMNCNYIWKWCFTTALHEHTFNQFSDNEGETTARSDGALLFIMCYEVIQVVLNNRHVLNGYEVIVSLKII